MEKMHSTLVRSLTNQIHLTQREVTILFTDIEDSTRYWGNRGNLAGRLMVDRHNRILLPIIRQFRGKVVKTIGDSVMAQFDQPDAALHAAIAIQQALQQARHTDSRFRIHVRIGLHIGEGIVEHHDVYGDVVNIASRIESEAVADEVLLSGRLLRRLNKGGFTIHKAGGFTPKGKHRRIALYRCHWQQHEDLLPRLKLQPLTPLGGRQAASVAGYLLTLVACLYLFHLNYLRYLLADYEGMALLFLNPATMLLRHWYITLLLISASTLALWRLLRVRAIPSRLFKLLKGAAAGGLLFTLLNGVAQVVPLHAVPLLEHAIIESRHLFVEVLQDGAVIYEAPTRDAAVLQHERKGSLLLLADWRRTGNAVWNKVLVDEARYGWLQRIQPADIGVPQQRISRADKFTLRYADLLLLILALPAAVWGYLSFHIRPL